jgi:phage shock protein E
MKKLKISAIAIAFIAAAALTAFADGHREFESRELAQVASGGSFASQTLTSQDLSALIGQPNFYLIDVRTPEEYRAGAIPSAINIPYDVIADNLPTQDREARIVVYCRSGSRAGKARATLEALGFRNVNNFGAVTNWQGDLVVR